jgi:hypothetical protein
MKLYIVANVARQINGEFVFVRIEKAFKDLLKAESYVKSMENPYKDVVQNSTGFSVECMCSRGIFDVEVEE